MKFSGGTTASCSDAGVAVRLGSADGELIYENVITSLPAGSTYETTFLWDLTEFPPTAQQITLYAIADEAEAIAEISTSNNTGTFGVIVPAWSLEGDVTLDCEVGIQDLIFVRNRLGQSLDAAPENFRADVNEDLVIDILDLVHVRNRLGARCEGDD